MNRPCYDPSNLSTVSKAFDRNHLLLTMAHYMPPAGATNFTPDLASQSAMTAYPALSHARQIAVGEDRPHPLSWNNLLSASTPPPPWLRHNSACAPRIEYAFALEKMLNHAPASARTIKHASAVKKKSSQSPTLITRPKKPLVERPGEQPA